jgi:CheY-like chemotaxis protein
MLIYSCVEYEVSIMCSNFAEETLKTSTEDEASVFSDVPANCPYVLVVDDDPGILSVVLLLLETEGYTAIGFSDSRRVQPFFEYLFTTGKEKGVRLPAVILLDLMMPVISGYDITMWLSQQNETATLPIVIMTADHRVSDIENVPGATDLLSKPFQIMSLLSKLEKYLTLPPVLTKQ